MAPNHLALLRFFVAIGAGCLAILAAWGTGPRLGGEVALAWAGMAGGANRAVGQEGTVIVVEAVVTPERFDRAFVAGLQADARGDHEAAEVEYSRAQRMGRCGPRCDYQLTLVRAVLAGRQASRERPDDPQSNVAFAIGLHNKLVSLRLDMGQMPDRLVKLAKRHYRISLELTKDSPTVRSDVLLGLAAFHGELGAHDLAMKLYRQVDLNGLESATAVGNLAYFYTTVGRFDLAFTALEKALSLDGPRGTYRDWARSSDDYHRIKHLKRFQALLELY